MQQITEWLEKLGLSEYAQRFAENGIDPDVLPDLTDQDLKDLGVVLGHRRKMLRAIASLDGVSAAAAQQLPLQHTARQSRYRFQPRRRQQVSVAISPSCSAIWWAQLAFPRSLMPRSGAIWLGPI